MGVELSWTNDPSGGKCDTSALWTKGKYETV